MLVLSAVTAFAAEPRPANLRGLYLSTGVGVGYGYSLIGTSTELDLRSKYGGVSAEVGAGAMLGFGFRLWSPGVRARVGLGLDVGSGWETWLTRESPSGYGGLTVEVDHDLGEFRRFGMRYGLGLGLVGAGTMAFPLPLPTMAVRYVL